MVNNAYENDVSYNCITPASFLELNSLFKTLLMHKRNEVNDIKQRYTVGLDKIKDAAGQVGIMQGELEAIQPHLTDASREVDKSVALVEKDLNEVSELEKIVKNEDAVVTEKTKQANTIRQDCQEDLAEVLTLVDSALDELNGLSQQEFAAVRGLKQPTTSIKLIMEAICILKSVKPDRLPDSGAGGKMIDDYWGPSKRLLGDQRFVSDLAVFEKDDINPKTMKLLREKYLSNSEIDPEVSKQNIGTGDAVIASLYKWLIAIESYDKVAKTVAPKKEVLMKLNLELEEATKSLKEKQAVFDEANEKLKVLQTELASKKAKKAELENEVETCSRKLERAEQLIGGLGGERDKWAEIVGNLGNKYIRLTGDILLSAAMVAYLGSFEFEEREAKLKEWMIKCRECKVPFSEDFSLQNILGDDVTIQAWQLCGLPSEQFSTDNGIITFTAKRWVLMMDPQEIGKKWIQALEKNNNLQILKQSDPEFLRNLESSIQFGQPALLENVGETLDPVLEPLLTKQTFKQGGSVCLKLGDSTLEYHKDFKLYITTKLKKPKIARDTVSKVALINFCITTLGLDEQLLTITVTRERPELEEERAQLIVQANDNRKQLRDIENKILEVLYSSKGNILEDENAIKILSSSKVLANEITEKQNIALESRKKIDENRAPYMQVASYVGVLFFTISRLNAINHMYQYSLSWFINLFCNSIDLADKSEELEERLQNIQDHVTLSLYLTVSRGLFDQDRLLFSFLLCINILQQRGEISDSEWNAFVESDTHISISNEDLVSELEGLPKSFKEILQGLSMMCSNFKDVIQHMEDNEDEWNVFCTTNKRTMLEAKFPGPFQSSLFQKLLLLKHINPINLVPAVYSFVEQTIGKSYTSFPLPDISKAHAESSCITPILFILGETTDPSNAIYELAERLNIVGKRLQFACLGYGKERHAEDLLREGIQAGNWVILQNCHMVPEWLARWVFDNF
jgi:dynein heavy chain